MSSDKPIKKITRKKAAQMSQKEFFAESRVPFKRLLGYVKPYRFRFGLSIFFGILFGIFNALMLFGIKFAFEVALPSDDEVVNFEMPTNEAEQKIRFYESDAVAGDEPLIELDISKIRSQKEAQGQDSSATQNLKAQLPSADYREINIPFTDKSFKIPKPSMSKENSIWLVIVLCMVVPIMMLMRGVLSYLNQYFMLWVGMRVLFDIRSQLFGKLMNHSQSFFHEQKSGELIQTCFNQTRMSASAGSDLAASLVKHPISILCIVAAIFWINPIFAICSLVVFPLCMAPVLIISKKVRQAGGKEEQEAGMIMVRMQEAFAGIRVVKSHAREDFETDRFNLASAKLNKTMMRWRKAQIIAPPLVETTASLGIASGLVYAWATNMSAADFLILFAALISIYPHAKSLSQVQLQLQKCLVASTKVFSILDLKPDIEDAPEAEVLTNVQGNLELKNLNFTYPKTKEGAALKEVNLHFEAGKSYALVGESGAGKSTIFSLLMRFYDPQEGTVLLDGLDIRNVTQESLRDHIGVVNQDAFLFHDSIEANIRYGKLDASEEEVRAAARAAHAEEFILEKDDGYESEVGDGGSLVSGGQRQRITIARAFVRNAPILLLDEATSALDSQSEQIIQEALEKLTEGKTVIAIAHRLSTILNSDAIVMMHEGKVLDVGPHAELLERCEAYRHLYELQYKERTEAKKPLEIKQEENKLASN